MARELSSLEFTFFADPYFWELGLAEHFIDHFDKGVVECSTDHFAKGLVEHFTDHFAEGVVECLIDHFAKGLGKHTRQAVFLG